MASVRTQLEHGSVRHPRGYRFLLHFGLLYPPAISGPAKIDFLRYYSRRYTRMLIPVAGAILVYSGFSKLTDWGEHSILWESPLWSLACEEIYYAMYPFLRFTRNKIGWKRLLPLSTAVGLAIA